MFQAVSAKLTTWCWNGPWTSLLAQASYSPQFLRTLAKTHLPPAKVYFQKNQKKLDYLLAHLADDTSRAVFSELVDSRIHGRLPACREHTPQYFPPQILGTRAQDVFVDCGAYTGDTLVNFQKFCAGNYQKIVAFEPEPSLFTKLQQHAFPRCTYIRGGVWHRKATLPFLALGSAGSRLEYADTSGDCPASKLISVPVYKIDEVPACADVTFLKMDVEGAELNALKGAEKTIRKNKPTLAVCIYHSDRDMLEIPLWILSLNLGYKLYIRHYSDDVWETVVYAV